MNIQRLHIIISSAAFVSALLFFAIYNQIIVLCIPRNAQHNSSSVLQKKQITHYYYHGDKWKTEKQELLWSENREKNIMQLINAWLALLDEEHITPKKTAAQSVLISSADCAYISFDHNILAKEETTFKKWMLIEGLLKTVTMNNIPIKHVQFLVQHQQLQDAHLDFSLAWPICGFIK